MYIIFATLNSIDGGIARLFYPETGTLSLEKIDEFFLVRDIEEERSEIPVWTQFQWDVVARAAVEVRKRKVMKGNVSEIGSTETTVAEKSSGNMDMEHEETQQ